MRATHSIQDYVDVVRDSITKHYNAGGFKKRVIVVGAGLAGLSAAYELLRAGHEPLILEAQHRVGGRIHFAGEHASLYHAWIQGAFKSVCAPRSPFTNPLKCKDPKDF